MGEVMVTVCRSQKLAAKMTAFLENAMKELAPILDAGPYLGRSCTEWEGWYWQAPGYFTDDTDTGCRIYSNHTHFNGIWRCANFALHRFAALKVGRRRRRFPDGVHLSTPVPYIRYGDFENWPVLPPSISLIDLKDPELHSKLEWTFVNENGTHSDPGRAFIYLGIFHPDPKDIYKQASEAVPEPGHEHRDKLEELMTPWCTEVIKPLDNFMTKLNEDW